MTTPEPKPKASKVRPQPVPEEVKGATTTTLAPVSREELNAWLVDLYDVTKITEIDLALWYDAFRYKGFDREEVLKQLKNITRNNTQIATQVIILCALRGPRAASITKLVNGVTPAEMGIPASGQQGTLKISCQRITAATADLAAFYLKKLNVAKRLVSHPLPAWLQFPSAGAITLPEELRRQHIDFHQKFSPLIGGVFREDIYSQMVANAYLDRNLRLFD
jgi:hypothetical protein